MDTPPKKPKFEYMSTNEWLGDATTHFMKSGDNLRSPENQNDTLSGYIPRTANGVRVEYDISFNHSGIVNGYKFTDLLTKAIYITPQSVDIATRSLIMAMTTNGITEEGRRIADLMRANVTDKYMLENDDDEWAHVKDVIAIPGTNVIKDAFLDMDKIDLLVKNGAFVKLHPITSKVWETILKKRWGDQVIPPTTNLYPILRNSRKVWFTSASETGLSASLMGKQLGMVQLQEKSNRGSFHSLYMAIDKVGRELNISITDRMALLLSTPQTGILTVYHENPAERVAEYFEFMAKNFPHKKTSP